MATITETELAADPREQRVVLRSVGWKGYTALLRLVGDRHVPRLVYLDGDVTLMSPSYSHEWLKWRVSHLVGIIAEELCIPWKAAGSTTLRRRIKEAGAEGDASFYFANVEAIRGQRELNLRRVPPPDLIIEAIYSHDPGEALEVYRRLGVAEIWVCDETLVQILVLQPNRRYLRSARSKAFPFLSDVEILGCATKPLELFDSEWLTEVRAWVRATLPPRLEKPHDR